MRLEIALAFRPYLEEAVARFRYLQPDISIETGGDRIELGTTDPEVVAMFRHTLYRQKIHRENESLRRSMIQGLLGCT